MSDEQKLIDRIIANYKSEQIKVSTPLEKLETPLEYQERLLAELQELTDKAVKDHYKKQWLLAANYLMMLLVGFLSVQALMMMAQKP